MMTDDRLVHPSNAPEPMLATEFGMTTDDRRVPIKMLLARLVNELLKTIDDRLEHDSNARTPMLVT